MGLGALGLAAILALAPTCARPARTSDQSSDAGAATAKDAGTTSDPVSTTSASADAGTTELTWYEAVRGSRWSEADAAIAKLSPEDQAKPEVRYARARIAIALGKHAEAVAALDKLEDDLPLMRELVAKTRAQAALGAGSYDKAAEWFGARSNPSSWLTAAEAWDKAGDAVHARKACDRVIKYERRSRSQEERARALRMKIVRLKEGDPAAADDARWLAINGVDDTVVTEANELLAKLTPPRPLTAEQQLARARVLAETLHTDDALRVIERAASTKSSLPPIDFCRAKAEAYWKSRTRYTEAASAYRQCAAMGGAHAAEDLFLSARALSRADRDAEALPAFIAVSQKHPGTRWAEEATFLVARSHILAGRWKESAQAFDDFVKRWPRSGLRKESDRYRALAHLAAKQDHKLARKLLEDLSGHAEDPISAARWTNLAALAALRDGDRTHAIARWSEVARSHPLTWPALVARARLAENQAPLPPAMDPSTSTQEPAPLTIELPAPIDLLHRIGFDAEAEDALRERESVVSGKAQGRGNEALCAAYGMLDRGRRRYQHALGIPSPLLKVSPGAQNRWAWECAFPRPYKNSVRASESESKLPPDLIWAVMRQESGFDPEVVSPARAVGLMQLLPETARTVARTANIPHDDSKLTVPDHNVKLGALYLRELLDILGDNVPLAVASYNAGPEAIQRWLPKAKDSSIDLFVEMIPFLETRGYVVRVMGNLARYGYLDRGENGVPALALDLK